MKAHSLRLWLFLERVAFLMFSTKKRRRGREGGEPACRHCTKFLPRFRRIVTTLSNHRWLVDSISAAFGAPFERTPNALRFDQGLVFCPLLLWEKSTWFPRGRLQARQAHPPCTGLTTLPSSTSLRLLVVVDLFHDAGRDADANGLAGVWGRESATVAPAKRLPVLQGEGLEVLSGQQRSKRRCTLREKFSIFSMFCCWVRGLCLVEAVAARMCFPCRAYRVA